jgi:hypothetical protein
MSFEKELKNLINCHSIENESNTPDFILAQFLRMQLDVWVETTQARDSWYNVQLCPANSRFLNSEPEERAVKEICSEPDYPSRWIPPKGGTGAIHPMKAGVAQEHEANIKSLWIALNELKKNFMDLQNMFAQVQYTFFKKSKEDE